jgi:hypothetical protein
MSEIVLREPLASRLRQEAEARGVDVESLIDSALRHYRFQSQRDKLNVESEWWRTAPPEFRARYAGEFVAIHEKSIVDHDADEESLRKRIRAKYGKIPVLVTPAEGRRNLRIVNTRLARS